MAGFMRLLIFAWYAFLVFAYFPWLFTGSGRALINDRYGWGPLLAIILLFAGVIGFFLVPVWLSVGAEQLEQEEANRIAARVREEQAREQALRQAAANAQYQRRAEEERRKQEIATLAQLREDIAREEAHQRELEQRRKALIDKRAGRPS